MTRILAALEGADWWRKYGDPEEFPVGTRVVTKKCGTDFRSFRAGHTGTVVKNEMRYLSVVVAFDNPIHHFIDDEPSGLLRWNFHPENLMRLVDSPDGPLVRLDDALKGTPE